MGEVFANKSSVTDPMYDDTFERFPLPKPPHNFTLCIVHPGINTFSRLARGYKKGEKRVMGEVFANKSSVTDPMYDNAFERFPLPKII